MSTPLTFLAVAAAGPLLGLLWIGFTSRRRRARWNDGMTEFQRRRAALFQVQHLGRPPMPAPVRPPSTSRAPDPQPQALRQGSFGNPHLHQPLPDTSSRPPVSRPPSSQPAASQRAEGQGMGSQGVGRRVASRG